MPDYSTPPEAPGFSGAVFSDTTQTTKVADLGLSCLYIGGGANSSTPPNANPDGPDTQFCTARDAGNTRTVTGHPGLGRVAGNGNTYGGQPLGLDCSLGPLQSKHCTSAPKLGQACTDDAFCGAPGSCNPDPRCIFGPPLPVPGANSTCVLNMFRADASGTVDEAAGRSSITLPLSSYIYLTSPPIVKFCKNGADGLAGPGPATPPGKCSRDADCTDLPGSTGACVAEMACPICTDFGTDAHSFHCFGGKNHGQACSPVGSKLTTADCLPRDVSFVGPLFVDLSPLGTETQTLAAVPYTGTVSDRIGKSYFCPAGGGAATCTATPGVQGSTCQATQSAFGRLIPPPLVKLIRETGRAAGNLTDNVAHEVTISAVFCIPASGNAVVDGGTGADLPGPGAVSIRGTFQLFP